MWRAEGKGKERRVQEWKSSEGGGGNGT